MSYLDPPGWPTEPDLDVDDPPARGRRHRARHADAAPDAYPAWDAGGVADGWPAGTGEPGGDVGSGGTDPVGPADDAPTETIAMPVRQGRHSARTAPGVVPQAGSPAPPTGRAGRAGRNLPAAIGVGLGLGALVLASLFVWRPAFLGVVVVAIAVATWEMARAVRPGGARPPLPPLIVGGALTSVLVWFGGAETLTLGLLATAIAAMIWRMADGPSGYQRDIAAAVLIAVYVPFLGGFAVLLARSGDGSFRVLCTLAAVVLSDTGGYIAGVFFGRHPMAPTVSPKKSWEGLVGSLLASAVGGAFLLYYLLHTAWWHGVVFGLAVSAAATLGDLAESMLKRDLGIKDMSTLLPGHGGLMDRLDSILFALPTAYAVLALLAPAAP
jgi:phosphatidate cytidylyltransferase